MDDLETRQRKMRERTLREPGDSRSPSETASVAPQSAPDEPETPEAERARRIRENYRDWLALSGERRQGPTRRVEADLSFGVKLEFGSIPSVHLENSAGELIDILIGLCHSRPVYLRKCEADRYITLLHELREFRSECWDGSGLSQRAVAEMSIRSLRYALEAWVLSYMADNCHPMLPAYALDTGRFLLFHLTGARRIYDSPSWEIAPLLSEAGHVHWAEVFGKSFKREFTQSFRGSVRCIVPPGGSVIPNVIKGVRTANGRYVAVNGKDAEVLTEELGPGSEFRFAITRCHLSESFYDSFEMEAIDELLQFDLMKEFQFHGKILVPHREDSSIIFEVPSSVPARWISHSVVREGAEEHLVPVPRWSLDDVAASTEQIQ